MPHTNLTRVFPMSPSLKPKFAKYGELHFSSSRMLRSPIPMLIVQGEDKTLRPSPVCLALMVKGCKTLRIWGSDEQISLLRASQIDEQLNKAKGSSCFAISESMTADTEVRRRFQASKHRTRSLGGSVTSKYWAKLAVSRLDLSCLKAECKDTNQLSLYSHCQC